MFVSDSVIYSASNGAGIALQVSDLRRRFVKFSIVVLISHIVDSSRTVSNN